MPKTNPIESLLSASSEQAAFHRQADHGQDARATPGAFYLPEPEQTERLVNLSVRVPQSLRDRLKLHEVLTRRSAQELVIEAVQRMLDEDGAAG